MFIFLTIASKITTKSGYFYYFGIGVVLMVLAWISFLCFFKVKPKEESKADALLNVTDNDGTQLT